MQGEPIVLVNRTSRPLTVKQNGRSITLQPGRNHLTSDWVRFAKLQNPRMGTFDPSGLEGDYLVGVEGHDDCTPIEPGREHLGIERFDRSQMDEESRHVVAIGTGVSFPRRRVPGEAGELPDDALFGRRDQ